MEKEIFDMYGEVELGNNEKCYECKKFSKDNLLKLVGHISVFHVGLNFRNSDNKYKVVFVGKNNWYNKEEFEAEKKIGNVADMTKIGKYSIIGKENKDSTYWKYIRAR